MLNRFSRLLAFGVTASLIGCGASPDTYLQKYEGIYSSAGSSVLMMSMKNELLVGVPDGSSYLHVRPNGKVDNSNDAMPVKVTSVPIPKAECAPEKIDNFLKDIPDDGIENVNAFFAITAQNFPDFLSKYDKPNFYVLPSSVETEWENTKWSFAPTQLPRAVLGQMTGPSAEQDREKILQFHHACDRSSESYQSDMTWRNEGKTNPPSPSMILDNGSKQTFVFVRKLTDDDKSKFLAHANVDNVDALNAAYKSADEKLVSSFNLREKGVAYYETADKTDAKIQEVWKIAKDYLTECVNSHQGTTSEKKVWTNTKVAEVCNGK